MRRREFITGIAGAAAWPIVAAAQFPARAGMNRSFDDDLPRPRRR
jgi:hypothetical protein